MSPLAPSKSTISCRSNNSTDDNSQSTSNIESLKMSRKIYSISELMKLRTIDCMQPAKMFNTPVLNDILRQDQPTCTTSSLFPQMQIDFLPKPVDSIQTRLHQFRNRHSARSIEELNPKNGTHSSKRHNRHNHNNGEFVYF